MKKYFLGKCFIIFIFCLTSSVFSFLKTQEVFAATNLLSNGDFATGDSTGWTVLESGGSGPTFSGNTFATSYVWNTISQTVDLVNAGYSAGELDAAPSIDYTVGTMQRFDHDGYYYLEYKLLAGDGSTVIASSLYGSSGSPLYLVADTALFDTAYTFSGYGAGARYAYIKIAGQDGSSDWVGQYGPYFSNISISMSDTTSPTVSALSPLDNATAIATTANLTVTFDENVDAETSGTVSLYKSDDTLIQIFTIPDAGLTGTGSSTITIDPAADLNEQTSYYMQISATAFDDTSSNSYAGISDTTTWNFTTGDFTNPTVSTLSPTDDATAIAVDANLIITFDEIVDRETGNIVIKKTSDDSIVETIDVTSGQVTGTGTTTITVNPTSDFLQQTGYYIQIDATVFDDTSSNSYAGISDTTTWNFTTGDFAAPVISGASPSGEKSSGTTSVSLSVTTNESATCKYSSISGTAFTSMTAFSSTGSVLHTSNVSSLSDGSSYNYYILCQDNSSNESSEEIISFSVASGGGGVFFAPSTPQIIIPPSFSDNSINSTVGNVYQMAISTSKDFSGVSWELYNESYKASEQILYIKFRSPEGGVSEVFIVKPFDICNNNSLEGKLVKYDNSPKIYLVKNCQKHWIINEETFAYYYSWNEFLTIKDSIVFDDGDNIIKPNEIATKYIFLRDLKIGMKGLDVKELQKYLNGNGFIVSESGCGSKENETEYFGVATQQALSNFQKANSLPAYGFFGPMTKTLINSH